MHAGETRGRLSSSAPFARGFCRIHHRRAADEGAEAASFAVGQVFAVFFVALVACPAVHAS